MNNSDSRYPASAADILDLVLAGGGHAHVAVLKRLGMKPIPGLRVTLVCPEWHTPYSGMLPGLIAGHYQPADMHIDLRRLARFAGAAIVPAAVTAIDADARQIAIADRPPLRYDLLSLNTGSTPAWEHVPGAGEHVIPVKPVAQLLARLTQLEQQWIDVDKVSPPTVAVVGGGAGSVELVLALAHRWRGLLSPPRLALFTRDDTLLSAHGAAAQARFRRILAERAIGVHTGRAVLRVGTDRILLADGSTPAADAVFWATHASAPDWLAGSGLALDAGGFVRVNDALQSVSHPGVFAAGDIAALTRARPKSGVFAVRQGPVLAANLRRYAQGRRLVQFRAQKQALALIGTGDREAVASRGRFALAGKSLWWIKERIDRRFMARYNVLPVMQQTSGPYEPEAGRLPSRLQPPDMRCGGCGAKVGHRILDRVLDRLQQTSGAVFDAAIEARDDAAIFAPPAGQCLAQSFDYLRDFIGDPYRLGEIAAQHALNDLYAMGATPHSALVHASVPLAAENLMEEQLYQMLAGASAALGEAGATLLGGHSSEAAELGIGFAVNGALSPPDDAGRPAMAPGMAVILTKPLGTGILFAADMRYRARGDWISAAIGQMRQSAAAAAACLQAYSVVACTDVTGFGLAGHLRNLLGSSHVDAVLTLDRLPLLDGAAALAGDGIHSSLYPQNLQADHRLVGDAQAQAHRAWPLLFDPQTAGGLLAVVPADQADDCLRALHRCGYSQATCIGRITAQAPNAARADFAQPMIQISPGSV